jgi:hypothetical protein
MANTQAPFGFRQLRRLDGGAPTAGFETVVIASSDTNLYFTGDPVVTSTTGPYITTPSSGFVQIRGIFMGCEYYNASVNRIVFSPYFPASVATSSGTADVKGWVCTDPEMLWIAQCSTIATVTSSQIGNNIGFTTPLSTGNTLSGISGVTLGSTSVGTSSSGPFRIYDFYSNYAPPGTNGTDNTSAGNILVVAANNWDRKNLTGI